MAAVTALMLRTSGGCNRLWAALIQVAQAAAQDATCYDWITWKPCLTQMP